MTDEKTLEFVQPISAKLWVKRGTMMVSTEALDIDDPDHIYNQIIAQGQRPEDYGYTHPYAQEFEEYSRDQLIEEIVSLRKEITAFHRVSAAGLF